MDISSDKLMGLNTRKPRQKDGNLQIKTESLLAAVQNNAIRDNYVKAKIDKTQQNSRCR